MQRDRVVSNNSKDLVPVTASKTLALDDTMQSWLDDVAADPSAQAQLYANAKTFSETKEARHAANTRRSYDAWWRRFETWCADPSTRIRGRALPPASPAMAFNTSDPRGQQILLIWLFEMVYGPEDPAAWEIWNEDFGASSPSTISAVLSALHARCLDRLGHELALDPEAVKSIEGLKKEARRLYGADRQATPLLAKDLAAMVRYLHGAHDPLSVRDRLLLELAAEFLAGVDEAAGDRVKIRVTGVLADIDDLQRIGGERRGGEGEASGQAENESFLEHVFPPVVPVLSGGIARHLWVRE